jgi:uncharacterized protein YprB with RNaseH-like and TPR domain
MNDLGRKIDGKPLSILIWDLETTGLNADFGYILCSSMLDVRTGKITTFRIDDKRNPDKTSDKWVVRETTKFLDSYDMVVTWYGTRFDFVFLDTRAALHRLKFHDRNYHRDLWFTSRGRFKLRSNRLAVVGEFMFGKSGKNAITPKYWNLAMRGAKPGIDYVVHHCELDLHETLKVYKRMMPLFAERLRKPGT